MASTQDNTAWVKATKRELRSRLSLVEDIGRISSINIPTRNSYATHPRQMSSTTGRWERMGEKKAEKVLISFKSSITTIVHRIYNEMEDSAGPKERRKNSTGMRSKK